MNTRPAPTRGAPLMVYMASGSTACAVHTGWPLDASRAMRRPSYVPTNTLPLYTAAPRETTSQPFLAAAGPGTLGSNCHSALPLLPSTAYTLLHAVVT